LGREDLDLSDPHAVQKTLNELKPSLIINASAYTEVDLAESQADLAMKINATSPGIMAEAARKLGAAFIHYSTDYVFDGNSDKPYMEDDPTHPLNEYGRSKLTGEENIKQAGGAYLILRTSWVYSMRGNSFANKVLGWARKNETLKIVSDQVSCPTWARMLAGVTSLTIAQSKADLPDVIRERRGIYHLAGSGFTSRYEWAKQILADDPDRAGQIVRVIEPALSQEFRTQAARPLFSALDCSRFEGTFGLRLPDWRGALRLAMTG